MSIDLTEAVWLLRQQRSTLRAGIVALIASAALMVLTATMIVAAPLAAFEISGGTGLAIGAAMGTAAIAAVVYRLWRVPLALALVRYQIVHP